MGTYERTMLKLERMAQQNTAQGQKWQTEMSNTAHQREVQDLVAAGLNPVLSSGGSGAQSYTTTIDSAVNGIAGMASAREGANATRYAARQSAAATRAAAAAQLEAARISAAAQNYRTDKEFEIQKYGIDNQLVNNPWAAIDKATRNLGLQDTLFTSKLFTNAVKGISILFNNPEKFIKNGVDTIRSIRDLNVLGTTKINTFLHKVGIPITGYYQGLAFKAIFKGSGSSLAVLLRTSDRYHNSGRRSNQR